MLSKIDNLPLTINSTHMFYVFQRGLLLAVTIVILQVFFPEIAGLLLEIITKALGLLSTLLDSVDTNQFNLP